MNSKAPLVMQEHSLISGLSQRYADRMAAGDETRTFGRSSIAAAYIIGAEETLHRICNIIRESSVCGGLQPRQAQVLLNIINEIENTPPAG